MTMVYVLVGLLMAAGLVGAILPILPGTPLIFAGALLYAFATDFTTLGPGRLGILAALAVVASALEYVSGALGARRFGGGRAAIAGALIGAVTGLAWPPLGLLVGPIVGAIAGHFLVTRRVGDSMRTGLGTAFGVIAGIVSHVVLALVMIALFLWWAWWG